LLRKAKEQTVPLRLISACADRINLLSNPIALFAICMSVYASADAFYVSITTVVACIGVVIVSLAAIAHCGRARRVRWLNFAVICLTASLILLSMVAGQKIVAEREIGSADEYDVFMRPCGTIDRSYLKGSEVAVLRVVECAGGPIVPPSRNYFVFVHDRGSRNDSSALVLGYRVWADGPAWRTEPTIKWLDKSWLLIAMRAPSFVTLQRRAIHGIRVAYAFGGTDIGDHYRLTTCAQGAWCDQNPR
jgi:hypothetical protein